MLVYVLKFLVVELLFYDCICTYFNLVIQFCIEFIRCHYFTFNNTLQQYESLQRSFITNCFSFKQLLRNSRFYCQSYVNAKIAVIYMTSNGCTTKTSPMMGELSLETELHQTNLLKCFLMRFFRLLTVNKVAINQE